MRFRRPVLGLLIAILLATTSSVAKCADIYLAHEEAQAPEVDPIAAVTAVFKRESESLTAGAVRIAVFPEGRLGDDHDVAQLIAGNIINAAIVSLGSLAVHYPALEATLLPYAFDSLDVANAVFNGPFGRDLAVEIEAHTDFIVLGMGDRGGFDIITTSRRQIKAPQDLAGLRLRTMPEAPLQQLIVTTLGATPVAISSPSEYQALAGGTLDGQMGTLAMIMARRYDQVQQFAVLTNHLYEPYVLIFNKATFTALPAGQQGALREAARLAVATGQEVARATGNSLAAFSQLTRRMVVTPLNKETRGAFRSILQPAGRGYLRRTADTNSRRLEENFVAAIAKATLP